MIEIVRAVLLAILMACGGEETAGPKDAACEVGAWCGNDCLENDDACWACGELRYDADCNCRPYASTCFRPDCSNPALGAEGDYCGTYWWCNRACAAGLTCRLKDATMSLVYLRTCQP